VPVGYKPEVSPKRLQYRQRSFADAKCGGSIGSFEAAISFRDLNRLPGLMYNDRSASANNGRLVSHKTRTRGADLPVGITDSKQGKRGRDTVTRSISVQVMANNRSRTKSFCYGHGRTRKEAVDLAKIALKRFVEEIEHSIA